MLLMVGMDSKLISQVNQVLSEGFFKHIPMFFQNLCDIQVVYYNFCDWHDKSLMHSKCGTAVIFFVPLVLLENQPIAAITGTGIAAMVYLFLGCSVGAFLLYNWGLRKLSAAASVSLMNLVPVFGILFSALFLKETITMTQILGGAVVIFGVILSTTTKQKGK